MTKIYTTTKTDGQYILDVSLKTGHDAFKPNDDYYSVKLPELLNTKFSEQEFYQPFLDKMRISYKKSKWLWEWILKQDKIILGCNCNSGTFCHAIYLAREIFPKLGAEYCGRWKE